MDSSVLKLFRAEFSPKCSLLAEVSVLWLKVPPAYVKVSNGNGLFGLKLWLVKNNCSMKNALKVGSALNWM